MNQLERLMNLDTTHDLSDFDDEPADTMDDLPASPVTLEFDKAEFERAGGPKDFQPITTPDSLQKVIANRLGLTNFGSAAGRSLAKTEEWTSPSGELWKREYDANGELIAAHVVDNDGGPLEKRASGNDVDFGKRASKVGMVNLVRTTIDGAPFILGYDHEGVNVYSRLVDEED